jgi:hypothetical protein
MAGVLMKHDGRVLSHLQVYRQRASFEETFCEACIYNIPLDL